MSCKNKMHGFIWVIIFLSVQLPVAVGPEPYTAAEYRVDGNDFRDELICHYFDAGYQIKEILALLAVCHNVYISIRHVKRLLRHFGRRRGGDESLAVDIPEAFLYELHSGGGDCLGYRSMTRRLRTTHNLNVQRSTVRLLQQVLDPIGVENRRAHRFRRRHYTARGPNFIIHIDGYDKLKSYGFAIHGAIDGFSRKVLWLTVGPSNNNPRIICNLYLNFVRRLNGVPFIVRADRGTENTLVANVQAALRWYHNDAFSKERSFMFGRSTSNQRIECWWSQLRRMCTSVWINFFKDMRDEGIFDNSDHIQVEVMRFCFSHLLQEDLDKSARDWNQHRIRRQRNLECPAGIPDIMYFAPEVYDAVDYKMPLNFTEEEILEVREEYCSDYPQYGCARWFRRSLEDMLGNLDNYQMPSDMHEARRLFVALKDMMLRE